MTERKKEIPESPPAPLLEARNITKTFPGVTALDHVHLEVHSGEVHAVVGENGAGKSTLMNILSGSISPDSGEIIVKGKPCRFRSPRDGENSGISIIHQELSLVPFMSVAENIFLGRAPTTLYGTISWKTLYAQASKLLEGLNLSVDLRGTAASNPIGVQQMVEIAKALSLDASMIIMDEPTSSLSESESERLFEIIDQLRKAGKGIVYITHRMEEVYRIAQRITVLRDGKNVGTARTEDLKRDQMISWMVGREVESYYTRHPGKPGSVVLEVEGLTLPSPEGRNPKVDGVSLELHAGEILGIAGLMGAGNSELLGAIFGRYGRRARGGIRINGRPVNLRHPLEAIKKGLCLLTNDRKASGLVMPLSVARNMTLASLSEVSKFGWLKEARERTLAKHYQDTLDIRVPSLDSEVYTLSGGNQQKVILAKWMMTNPSVILLDEPTRGIDVGAKAEIYRLMDAWTARGKAILLITSELPELLAMSDRILVMRRGRVSAEFSREEANPQKVMAAAV